MRVMPAATAASRAQAPLWQRDCGLLERRPLSANTSAEVCVVGAGVTGLTTAYLLARTGHSVLVVDEGPIGGGQSGRGAGQLSTAAGSRYCAIERMHGTASAAQVAASQKRALDLIESIIRVEALACDFRRVDGYLFSGDAAQSPQLLQDEHDAAQRAGVRDLALLPQAPELARHHGACLRFGGQGELHPLKYLLGLAQAAERCGAKLHSRTRVSALEPGGAARLCTETGARIEAGHFIFASDLPPEVLHASQLRQAPYTSYMIAARLPPSAPALYWDTCDPYHHVRRYRDGDSDLLLVGGGDHRARLRVDAQQRFACLERWAQEHFPQIGPVECRWSGQVAETVDGLPYIGQVPGAAPNMLLACGGARMGFVCGTIAALLFCDRIAGRDNPWAAVYSPERCNTRQHLVQLLGEKALEVKAGAAASRRAKVAPRAGVEPATYRLGGGRSIH